MSKSKTGFVLRVDSVIRSSRPCPYFASPCGATHTKTARSADAKLFATEEEAEAFGCKISRPHLMIPVETFTVLPAVIHTVKISESERALIHKALSTCGEACEGLCELFAAETAAND